MKRLSEASPPFRGGWGWGGLKNIPGIFSRSPSPVSYNFWGPPPSRYIFDLAGTALEPRTLRKTSQKPPGSLPEQPRNRPKTPPDKKTKRKINLIEGFGPRDPSHEKERAKICRKLKSRASETLWASSYGQIIVLRPRI